MPRIPLLLFCLAFGTAAHGQQTATSWVSAQWAPMTEENSRLFQQADAEFKSAVEADYQERVEAARPKSGPTHKADPDDRSFMVPNGRGEGPLVPRGKGKKPPPPTVTSLNQVLPASLDFAAPTSGGLIVQRMSSSVLFGRTDGDDVVVLPLSGEADLPHGMRGSIREDGRQLLLNVQLPTGEVVDYRYGDDPAAPGGLNVNIRVEGALPGKIVQLQRRYRRAQVNVGEMKKAGQ